MDEKMRNRQVDRKPDDYPPMEVPSSYEYNRLLDEPSRGTPSENTLRFIGLSIMLVVIFLFCMFMIYLFTGGQGHSAIPFIPSTPGHNK